MVLFDRKSARQHIELVCEADGSLSLTLDGYWQFSSLDERSFHESLVDCAVAVAPSISRVLILGGGDGLAARNVLRYPEVETVVLCEIDTDVIEMAATTPRMVELNEAGLTHPKLKVVVCDALEFLPQCSEVFDLVILDFPSHSGGGATPQINGEFLDATARVLAPDGVISVQVSLDADGFWPVLDLVESRFPWIQPRLVELHDDTWANTIVASARKREVVRPFALEVELSPQHLESLLIRNRSGNRFETEAYGTQPEM